LVVAIINETTMSVPRKTIKASRRGRRIALHIRKTIIKVKGHGI